ncbi:MAG TPA: alanine--tRNA ligase [Candidatus Paceibacterota bacterium]|nr:alanine--tRNA ligase [Candidatus Paceibacterota bacterium]
MTSAEVRKRFLAFFEKNGHAIIPSASLIPENDPSVLFNTAGMQPLVPYLLGEKHPLGTRLANLQKCVRTGDIDDIGDKTHATFFEMMGNWSLGDYFKKEAITWSFELLTSKDEGFGLDPARLYVTCFEGDANAPRDDESASIWKDIFEKNGVTGERIYFMPAKNNWWSAGDNGPCGPDTEMFYDLSGTLTSGMTKEQYLKADEEQKVVEIWNDVFMEYVKKDGKVVGKLPKKNVDTGSGFERVCAVLQGKDNIFDTDIFSPIMKIASSVSSDIRKQRIISDHMRTAIFMIADGVTPSNTDRGYILRRLIRRAVFNTDAKKIDTEVISEFVEVVAQVYDYVHESIVLQRSGIKDVLVAESEKFAKTLDQGVKEFEKLNHKKISGEEAFTLFSSYGFPIDLTVELAKQRGGSVDIIRFNEEFKKHQDLSRAGAEQKFKGGLGDTSEMSLKYHTTTHLLHQALRQVLGTHVSQKGSNITAERLRFDFTHTAKMTDEEKKRVEEIVNTQIKAGLPVHRVEMPKAEAEKTGALHFFGDKYGDVVSVYYIGDSMETAFSKEFCGGPHVENIGSLGTFKIQKEEAVSAGVRRIKAVLS